MDSHTDNHGSLLSWLGEETQCVRAGLETDPVYGSVMPPLFLSTNFTFAGYGDKRQYDYGRSGNPTRDELGRAVGLLEGSDCGGIVTASGIAALDLVMHLLDPDDLLVAPHDLYGGTYRLLQARGQKGHFRHRFVNQTDPASLDEAFAAGPKMILVETPSNPLLRITDMSEIVRRAGEHGTWVVVDNTFLSPALQKPLELGADIVVHSTTKFINGHSDVVGGVVVSASQATHDKLSWWANCLGVTGSPIDSFLVMRGLRTLHVRVNQQQANARSLAEYLARHEMVRRVYYPGLPSHVGHEVARSQQKGFGTMLSFEIDGGAEAAKAFVENVSLFSLAESLGGVESLLAHPATMTHLAMTPDARQAAGISDSLLRLSVGLEASHDLIADLERGLLAAAAG